MSWERLQMWVFALLVVMGAAAIGVIGWQVREQSQAIDRVASEAHQGVCAFRSDLERRVEATELFLRRHPGPEPFPGITREDLERSIANQRQTVRALAFVTCP